MAYESELGPKIFQAFGRLLGGSIFFSKASKGEAFADVLRALTEENNIITYSDYLVIKAHLFDHTTVIRYKPLEVYALDILVGRIDSKTKLLSGFETIGF